jgi:hypothetical protein
MAAEDGRSEGFATAGANWSISFYRGNWRLSCILCALQYAYCLWCYKQNVKTFLPVLRAKLLRGRLLLDKPSFSDFCTSRNLMTATKTLLHVSFGITIPGMGFNRATKQRQSSQRTRVH